MRFVLRNVVWFSFLFLMIIASLPMYCRVRWLENKGRHDEVREILDRIVQPWVKKVLEVGGITVEVSGLENIPEGPVVFASNHQGYFDIPVLLAFLDRPYGFVAKAETKKIPVINGWMKLLRCVFLNRENPREGLKAVNEAIGFVENGHSIILFPEGTTSDGDEMRPFKTGALRIATKTDVPVVPVAISGTWKIMIYVRDGVTPGHVKMSVLPAVDVSAMDKAQKKELPALLHSVIKTEVKRLQAQ